MMSFWKQRMQVSAVDIRRDIYGQEEEKQEFKHGAD
jgi:hypothetical protein